MSPVFPSKTSIARHLVAGLGLAATAVAALADPAEECNRFDDPKLQIRGCTAFIKKGLLQPAIVSQAYTNRGIAYGNLRKPKLAIADFTEAIKLDDTVALPFYNRGNAYFDDKKIELALADFTAAIAREPTFALAYFNRGLIREQRGERALSVSDYQQAFALDPTMEEARKGLERLGAAPGVPGPTAASDKPS